MELNHTCLQILRVLREEGKYTSIETLAEYVGKTKRSVRYSLEILDDFFLKRGVAPIQRKHAIGVKLEKGPEVEALLNQLLAVSTPFLYKYSNEEREFFIKSFLLYRAGTSVSVQELADKLKVSYGTVTTSLDNIEKSLKAEGLSLMRKTRMGITIKGEEKQVRDLLLKILSDSVSIKEYQNYCFGRPLENKSTILILDEMFREFDRDFLDELVKGAEIELNRVFSDEAFVMILFHILITAGRVKMGKSFGKIIDEDSTYNQAETITARGILEGISERYKVSYAEREVFNLTECILTAKTIKRGAPAEDDPELSLVVDRMILEMEQINHVDFGLERRRLKDNLMAHLIPTVHRLRFNIEIVNPLYEELLLKHQRLLLNTRKVAKYLELYCGKPVNDYEVSYLALYFLVALNQINAQEEYRPKIVVACGTGYGTAELVASQIRNIFDVEIVAVQSGRDTYNMVSDGNTYYDYIISTVDLTGLPENKYIRVNPVFSKEDIKKLSAVIGPRPSEKWDDSHLDMINAIEEIAIKYGARADSGQMKYEFLSAIIKVSESTRLLRDSSKNPSLSELIDIRMVQMGVECEDWREVVQKSVFPLERDGFVKTTYKDAIIHNLIEYGVGMVMYPGILIAHAEPKGNCNRVGVCVTKLQKPINFGSPEHDPVRLVFALSIVDDNRHMDMLTQLFKILSDQRMRSRLINSRTKEEILMLIDQFSSSLQDHRI